jgi:hypothetical protein
MSVTKKKSGKNTKKTKPKTSTKSKKKIKKQDEGSSYSGIVIVDDDLIIDRESELEERRAFLEEAKSQEASSD